MRFAALVVGAALAAWIARRVWGGHPPAPPGAVLCPRELALLTAVAEAVFPPGGPLPRSGGEAGVPAYVDRLVAASAPRQRRLMRLLFAAVEHATLLFPGPGLWRGRRRLSAQPLAARIAVLEGWRTSSLFSRRLVFASLRAIVTFGYFADREVQRRLALDPFAIESPICEADLLYPRVGASRATIAFGLGDLTPPSDGTPLHASAPGAAR